MTDASTTGAVERFDPYTDEGNREGYGEMEVQADGDWVRFTDYQAAIQRAEAAEQARDQWMLTYHNVRDTLNEDLTEARAREAAARDEGWNAAIEAAARVPRAPVVQDRIRALRRAAPTEGEA